jgi:Protein of unknown function (DUF2911)
MTCLRSVLIAIGLTLMTALPSLAQERHLSPHETNGAVISGNRVTIVYGRPYTTKPGTTVVRKIWGGLVPYGAVWRTGADEATLLITQQAIVLGGATIPAGCYTLWSLPLEDGTAKLIINKQIGQWGEAMDRKQIYDEANDVARVDLKKSDLDKSVDQFTITIGRDPDVPGGGLITLKWELTAYSVPFTVAK